MSNISVKISARTDDGLTLQQLGNVIRQRMTYLHESARDSIAAVAIQALRSIRTVTKVAKKNRIKVNVVREGSLYPSFRTEGGHRTFCLRSRDTKARYIGAEKVVCCVRGDYPNQQVFRYAYSHNGKTTQYLIVATSIKQATERAKSIASGRAMRYAGLAKRAVSMLMYKVNTKKVNDGLMNPLVENTAHDVTSKQETVTKTEKGGTYRLVLTDALRYALDAIKGGQAQVNVQLKKAMNKVVSVINNRLKNSKGFFGQKKLPTPFPEVKSRKK